MLNIRASSKIAQFLDETIPRAVKDYGTALFETTKSLDRSQSQRQSGGGIFSIFSSARHKPSLCALEELKKDADSGNIEAQKIYGLILCKGEFLAQDLVQGRAYLELAAEALDPEATALYGLMLCKGEGGARDTEEAYDCFRKVCREKPAFRDDFVIFFKEAADEGDIRAHEVYGKMLLRGQFISKNETAAREYLSRAVMMRGLTNYERGSSQFEPGVKVFQRLPHRREDLDLLYTCGMMAYEGIGGDKDFLLARGCFEKLISQIQQHSQDNGSEDLNHPWYVSHESQYILVQRAYAFILRWDSTNKRDSSCTPLDLVDFEEVDRTPLESLQNPAFCDLVKARQIYQILSEKTADSNDCYRYAKMCYLGEGGEENLELARCYFTKAAEQGHVKAQYYCGVIWLKGQGVEKDTKAACDWFQLAGICGKDRRALYEYGQCLYAGDGRNKDLLGAVDCFRLAAEQNYPLAQSHLASILRSGEAGEKDLEEAKRLFELAAKGGDDPEDHYQFALMCYYDQGKGRDFKRARAHFQRAAEQEHVEAQYHYAGMLRLGKGGDRDSKLSDEYVRLAAAKGHAGACYLYATFLAADQTIYGDETEQEIRKLLTQAAEKNFLPALYGLGCILADDKSDQANLDLACRYFQRAADRGDADSQYEYAMILYRGYVRRSDQPTGQPTIREGISIVSVIKDEYQSVLERVDHYLNLAAEKKHLEAMFVYADMLKRGQLGEKNERKARELFKCAGELNHLEAQFLYGKMVYHGQGDDPNLPEARKIFEQLARQGHNGAILRYANMLMKGEGGSQNEAEANLWQKRAMTIDGVRGHGSRALLAKPDREGIGGDRRVSAALKPGSRLSMQAIPEGTEEGVFLIDSMATLDKKLLDRRIDPKALYEYGIQLLHGVDVDKNPILARECFEQAAQYNHSGALFHYAWMSCMGEGGQSDPFMACAACDKLLAKGDQLSENFLKEVWTLRRTAETYSLLI